jgi:hypothetical protein
MNAAQHRQLRRLMVFFALVYIVEGLGQTGGLVAQPLNYFLKEQYGWSPVEVTAYLTVLNFPWIIKPVYGLVSDFIPLSAIAARPILSSPTPPRQQHISGSPR